VKTDHGKPATGRRLESSVATAVATFGGTSALKTAWAAVVMAGRPPPSGGLSREALTQWVIGCGSWGSGLVLTSKRMGEISYL
jgi:hypothetical protein